jgi:hypothetical protein
MTIHRVSPEATGHNAKAGIVPNSAEYRRYAEVARRLAKQQQGSDGFMWAQLAALWDEVADRKAAKEGQSSSAKQSEGEV